MNENKDSAVSILRAVIYLSVAALIIWILIKYLLVFTMVDGSSMSPTLENGEILAVNKVSFKKDSLKRYDIVVFKVDKKLSDRGYYVKRVIGLPGEKVYIDSKGRICINGIVLEDDLYGKGKIKDRGMAAKEITIGDDEIFCLGDNRNHSEDSRFEDLGNVRLDTVLGRAEIRIWPVSKYGYIDLYRQRKDQE